MDDGFGAAIAPDGFLLPLRLAPERAALDAAGTAVGSTVSLAAGTGSAGADERASTRGSGMVPAEELGTPEAKFPAVED